MIEKISPPISEKEKIKDIDIFNISKAKIVISCICGQDSSPRLTRDIFNKGNNDFACLSGGIYRLANYFNDQELISNTNVSDHFCYENEKLIFQQTKKSSSDYYRDLKNKKILLITHSTFLDIEKTITGQALLNEIGVKEILYFKERKDAQEYVRKEFDIKF